MVRLSIARLSGHNYSVKGLKLPGLDSASLKKYPALLPIHFFTMTGLGFGTFYTCRLLEQPDTIINKYTTPGFMTKAKKMSLLPIHAFTVIGMVFGGWYTYRLASIKDTCWNKYGDRAYMEKPTKITLFQPFADYKNKNANWPAQMPELKE